MKTELIYLNHSIDTRVIVGTVLIYVILSLGAQSIKIKFWILNRFFKGLILTLATIPFCLLDISVWCLLGGWYLFVFPVLNVDKDSIDDWFKFSNIIMIVLMFICTFEYLYYPA